MKSISNRTIPAALIARFGIILAIILAATLVAHAQTSQSNGSVPKAGPFPGEPVELAGNSIYFTSWKYVRPGQPSWTVDSNGNEDLKVAAGRLETDGNAPARLEPWDMPRGVRLVVQRASLMPVKDGQIVAHLYDQGKFKAWPAIGPCTEPEPFSTKEHILAGHNNYLRYTESSDGEHWTFPNLGLYEYAGNKDNNICFRGDLNGSTRGMHQGWVFVDPSSKEERYKFCYAATVRPEEVAAFNKKYPGQADPMADRGPIDGRRLIMGLFGAVSPDGIHWKMLDEPLMIHHADTLNSCDYDSETKQYVAYVRMWQTPQTSREEFEQSPGRWISVGRRSVGRAISKDFRHFDPPQMVLTTSPDMKPSDVFYTNSKTTLPGTNDHVMFPWIWEVDSDGGTAWLYSSTDGACWAKVPGGPIVEQGPPGSQTGALFLCEGNLLEFPDGTWRIGCVGSAIPHKYPGRGPTRTLFPNLTSFHGYAAWPKGRLVAIEAVDDGEFATVAVVPPGNRIRLNAQVKPSGYLKVAVGSGEDAPGRTFADCDRMVGDSEAMPVTWNGQADLKQNGKAVILRFRMRQAKLFGIEFVKE